MKTTENRRPRRLLTLGSAIAAIAWAVAQTHVGLFERVEAAAPAQVVVTATASRTPTPVNIGNFVWDDLDQDGRQDAGEPGLAGVTVQLWNTAKTMLLASATTNASGNYALVAPQPGNYRVRVILPGFLDSFTGKDLAGGDDLDDSDINPTGANLGFTDIISIASNVISITSIDAGIIVYRPPTPTRTPTPINLGNLIWNDLDGDGIQDAGEPGVPNVNVQLWNAAKTQIWSIDVTDANGRYAVIAPTPGDYRIRVVLPWPGAQFSPKDSGGDNLIDSDFNPSGIDFGFTDSFNIASNVISITHLDGGVINPTPPTPTATVGPFSIGDRVWQDLNNNGGQDAGELGLFGLQVQLWNSTKTTLYDTSMTDSDGRYSLNAPGLGSYRVRVVLPVGQPSAGFTLQNAACNPNVFLRDLCDSDVNAAGPDFGFSTIYTFTASNNIASIDAGLINITPISTPTSTPTPPLTATPTPTPTGTPIPTPIADLEVFLPAIQK